MTNKSLQKQLEQINSSTLHNLRFLLESYSNEVLEAIDRQTSIQAEAQEDALNIIRREVSSVIRTLQGIETVINHHYNLRQQEIPL